MKRNIFAFVLVLSTTTSVFSQVFTSFSVRGSLTETRLKNSISKIETIVDETFDIKNLDFKYKLNSGTSVSDSTPVGKDFTKPQYIKLENANEGNKVWEVAVNQLKGTALPFALSFSADLPIDIKTPNPKPWAGYGLDYKRADAIYFFDEGVAFYIAFNPGAKELKFNMSLLWKEEFAGEVGVETSANLKNWSTIATCSASKPILKNSAFSLPLKPDVKFVRWVYYTRVKQNVTLNNISVK
ncbi:MAG: hypothetical protein WCG93_12745 [Paludibacter sp.]